RRAVAGEARAGEHAADARAVGVLVGGEQRRALRARFAHVAVTAALEQLERAVAVRTDARAVAVDDGGALAGLGVVVLARAHEQGDTVLDLQRACAAARDEISAVLARARDAGLARVREQLGGARRVGRLERLCERDDALRIVLRRSVLEQRARGAL